jgi:hypothetical protein
MLGARLLAYVTGTVNQELLLRNEYLTAENWILGGQIKGRLLLSGRRKGDTGRDRAPPGSNGAGGRGGNGQARWDVDASARRVVAAKQDSREGDFAAAKEADQHPEAESDETNYARIYNRTVLKWHQAMLLISWSAGVLANRRMEKK